MVQQHFALVPAMTARENVALGRASARELSDDTIQLAASLGVRLDESVPVEQLPVSEQQRIELLKALSRGARVLILDEPTAALAPSDADALFAWLRGFRERGGSVVLITHKLREALDISDEISVLRHGVVTWHGPRADANFDVLVATMLGQDVRAGEPPRDPVAHTAREDVRSVVRAEALHVRDERGTTRVRDATVSVAAGEIVGVAGVEGSGAKELLYAIAGRLPPAGGRLALPNDIGFIPDDRQRDALLMNESVAANVALRRAGRRSGWLRRRAVDNAAEQLVRASGVRAPDVRAPVSALSGGNQQRLVVGRELDGDPPLVVAMNPTRGLDVAATAAVQQRLRQAARAGMAVVYYSADLDELIGIADRIVVLFDGRLREVPLDRDVVGRAMLGAA
jgi:simple sugar transport system ATP-binding protein